MTTDTSGELPGTAAVRSAAGSSVRPPDRDALAATATSAARSVTGADPAAARVLAGWDPDGDPPRLGDRRPVPVDTLVVGGAALAGAFVGAARGGPGRLGRGLRGALAGAIVAGVARRVWRAP